MFSFLAIAASSLALYFSTFVFCFLRNLYNARKVGLPIIAVPWDQNHFIWMIISVPLRSTMKKILPKAVWNRLSLTIYGWEFHEKLRPFSQCSRTQELKTFFLVTCGKGEISTCDPEFASEILRRPHDFMQPDLNSLFMGRFGSNVLTSNGDSWARQRRLIAGVINERISKSVFNESTRQTEGLLGEVYDDADGQMSETNGIFDMMKKITIHVLSGAGMGTTVNWKENDNEKPSEGYHTTYIEACKTVIGAVAGPIILPHWFTGNYPSFLPGHKSLKELHWAMREYPVHTQNLLDKERQRTVEQGDSKSNIMSQLLQASERDSKAGKALSEEEMISNLFLFTAAGFDTTANTLSYALILLCRYPDWQNWMMEEIDDISRQYSGEAFDYVAVFPRAVRVMAVMLETLRLYTPVIHLAKETKTSQVVNTSKGTYRIPANCQTYVDTVGLHLDPKVWRDVNKTIADNDRARGRIQDELIFRPSRWVNPPGSQQPLFQPPRGSYIPWSGGPRVCPGQKMAQVEFTATFLTLFRRHRIEVVPLRNGEEMETGEELDARLDALLDDSISILTLQMQGVYEASDHAKGGKGVRIRLTRRR